MMLKSFRNSVEGMERALISREYYEGKPEKRIFGFQKSKREMCALGAEREFRLIKDRIWKVTSLGEMEGNKKHVKELLRLVSELERYHERMDVKSMLLCLSAIKKITAKIKEPGFNKGLDFRVPKIAEEIRDDVMADINEMKRCYDAGAYRSAVVLCGRIMETILHRKYYETTGRDILEKSPGIGLGNLIGKLKDRGVNMDPAIMQQVHLINQVRVFSVHKKQEAFLPSKEQAHAIILYTLDCLNKL